MGKKLTIGVQHYGMPKYIDDLVELCNIDGDEYKNLIMKHKVTDRDFNKAIKILCTYFVQNELKSMLIDLDKFDESLEPAKEMSISDIEKELGYKIKIVDHRKD